MKTFDCTDIRAMLSALIDDELDAENRHAAERHLAECAACRETLDRAEASDRMVAMQAEQATAALDARFEERVLARTVGFDDVSHGQWTNRVGWFAAAASLFLAIAIWMMDSPPGDNAPLPASGAVALGDAATDRVQHVANMGSMYRSWTFDGDLPDAATNAAREATSAANAPAKSAGGAAAAKAPRRPLDDAETLMGTALVMRHLTNADLRTFSDIERIRQIAEYDELPSRLRELRPRLNANERPVVLAAEALILRIVRGPLSMDDVQTMRRDAQQLELAERLDAMAGPPAVSTSL